MSSNGYHDKIRKILAMLEGAKTEGEAKAANLALQRLLAKSNLTAEQVGCFRFGRSVCLDRGRACLHRQQRCGLEEDACQRHSGEPALPRDAHRIP